MSLYEFISGNPWFSLFMVLIISWIVSMTLLHSVREILRHIIIYKHGYPLVQSDDNSNTKVVQIKGMEHSRPITLAPGVERTKCPKCESTDFYDTPQYREMQCDGCKSRISYHDLMSIKQSWRQTNDN